MTSEATARRTLGRLADHVILWRGPSLSGTDVDVVVLPGSDADVEAALTEAGLTRAGDGDWTTAAGDLVLDVLPAAEWPGAYPPLADVRARAGQIDPLLPPVASAADRMLIFAADAVAGRPVEKLAAKLRPLVDDREACERARAIARAAGDTALVSIAADPQRLESSARRGVLPYRRAVAVAARSPRARAALRTRMRRSAHRRLRRVAQKRR